MRFLRRFFIRLSNFTTGRRADQRLQEEMAAHVAFQTEEHLRAGMPPGSLARPRPFASTTTPSKVFRLLRIFSSISATRFACCTGLPDFP